MEAGSINSIQSLVYYYILGYHNPSHKHLSNVSLNAENAWFKLFSVKCHKHTACYTYRHFNNLTQVYRIIHKSTRPNLLPLKTSILSAIHYIIILFLSAFRKKCAFGRMLSVETHRCVYIIWTSLVIWQGKSTLLHSGPFLCDCIYIKFLLLLENCLRNIEDYSIASRTVTSLHIHVNVFFFYLFASDIGRLSVSFLMNMQNRFSERHFCVDSVFGFA